MIVFFGVKNVSVMLSELPSKIKPVSGAPAYLRRCTDYCAHVTSLLITLLTNFVSSRPRLTDEALISAAEKEEEAEIAASTSIIEMRRSIAPYFWQMNELCVASLISLERAFSQDFLQDVDGSGGGGRRGDRSDRLNIFSKASNLSYYRKIMKYALKLYIKILPEAMSDEQVMMALDTNPVDYFNRLSAVQRSLKFGIGKIAQRQCPRSVYLPFEDI